MRIPAGLLSLTFGISIALLVAGCDNSSPSSTATPSPPAVVARGEEIFQRTAGGQGCASCHGASAQGKIGPNITKASASDIQPALKSIAQMSFIKLNDEEVTAVAAYLQALRAGQTIPR